MNDPISDGLSRPYRVIYDQYKNKRVMSVEARRNPINKAFNILVSTIENTASFSWNKIEQDKYYHLYLVITLEGNIVLQTEKNLIINITREITPTERDGDKMTIALSKHITLKEMMNSGLKRQGNRSFWLYQSLKANCQDYILAICSRFMTNKLFNFVKQDMGDLVKATPSFIQGLVNAFTEIGGIFKKGLGLKSNVN
jgi:hypothetical protein